MDAQRFFPVAYDSRNHPKVRMMRMQGAGIAEYGRYVALLGILYDLNNRLFVGERGDARGDAAVAYLASELDLPDAEAAREWLRGAAACGLIDEGALDEFGVVASGGVGKQLAYKAERARCGKSGGRPRKKKAETDQAGAEDKQKPVAKAE